MPTAPKLIAGIYFLILAWFCADLVVPLLPEGTQTPWLHETMAVIGAICGWIMSGSRAGDGTHAGFGYGLTTVAMIVFWGVLVFSGNEMLKLSMKRRYDGAVEALQAMVSIGLEYLVLIGIPSIVGALVVGGLFGGWLTEWVAKRWS